MSDAMQAGTITISGHGGDEIDAYLATPVDGPPRGSVVVIHHLPGWDRGTKEITRRFAEEGFTAICPHLYSRQGGTPEEASAAARADGGITDEQLVGDVAGAVEYLKGREGSNGKVGVIGYCSGGRQSFLAATSLPLDAAVDCYGGFLVEPVPDGFPFQLRATPIVDRAPSLACPLLGLFGADDQHPAPEHVAQLSAALDAAGKEHEFHVYPGTTHGFFSVDREAYRPLVATEAWQTLLGFFRKHLQST